MLPLAIGIAVGRLGCFFAGLPDYTYGSPAALPWAVDLGDGIGRHPVQLYESLAMAGFAAVYVHARLANADWARRHAFHALIIFYAGQRFLWEFLKPYPAVLGPLNVFHLLMLGLIAYGLLWWGRGRTTEHAAPPEPQQRKAAHYLFHGQTTSLCETCLELVPAKVIIEDDKVFYLKRCRDHGVQKTLISDDLDYWRQQKLWIKPGDRPLTTQTRTEAGCPFDCGLCPDHEQHSCLAIVEINEACNLACPVCFANATDVHGSHRSVEAVERMLDALVASEGEPDLVQLSGGEPTIHPRLLRRFSTR